MLNFYFKSRFSVKPSKFPMYFAHDCRYQQQRMQNEDTHTHTHTHMDSLLSTLPTGSNSYYSLQRKN